MLIITSKSNMLDPYCITTIPIIVILNWIHHTFYLKYVISQEQIKHVFTLTSRVSLFFSSRSSGHRLPWSQVLGEKVSLLPVGHTRRMPYLLFANLISISKIPRLLPDTDTQHPKNPGRCGPVIFSIQWRFWGCSPRTRPGRTSDLGRQNANV